MIRRCECCAKQVVKGKVDPSHQYITTSIGAKAAGRSGFCICGHCAKDLDENGLFPEELAIAEKPL